MPLIDEYKNNAPPPPATPAPLFFVEEFARNNHGYAIEKRCYEYAKVSNNNNVNNTDEIAAAATSSTTAATAAPAPATTIPQECLDGSSDAQNAAAVQQLVSNLFTFFGSSLVGSLSDQYGRRPFLLLGVFSTMMPPLVLVLLQAVPASAVWGNPIWYYRAGMLTGLVNFFAVSLSSVADVVEPRHRATGFGLVLAGFSLGFAVAPTLAVLLGHWTVSVLSFLSGLLGFLTVAFFFPETVPTRASARVHRLRRREMQQVVPDFGNSGILQRRRPIGRSNAAGLLPRGAGGIRRLRCGQNVSHFRNFGHFRAGCFAQMARGNHRRTVRDCFVLRAGGGQ